MKVLEELGKIVLRRKRFVGSYDNVVLFVGVLMSTCIGLVEECGFLEI